MMKTFRRTQRGFSLVELVVVIVILAILSLGITLFMKPISDLWMNGMFQAGTVTEARLALGRMARDIEQIKGSTSITASTATTLTFNDVNNINISFTITGTTLTRNGVTLLKNVSSLQFQYYDLQNNTTTTPANIRRVKINLTVTSGARSLSLYIQASPRNLNDG